MRGFQRGSQVEDEGGLVTIGELVAADALGPDFSGQLFFVAEAEAVPLEEAGDMRQGEHTSDAEVSCLADASFEEACADAVAVQVIGDSDGADFGEVLPIHVESGAGDDLTVFVADPIISQAFVDVMERAGEHHVAAGIETDEFPNPRDISDPGFANAGAFVLCFHFWLVCHVSLQMNDGN
jgi:hypothetical protein